jgi:hypothetical protein
MKKKGKDKEVATTMATGQAVREKSFGSTPPDIGLSKSANMATFGYKIRGGTNIWPGTVTSTDSKTGYPENRN